MTPQRGAPSGQPLPELKRLYDEAGARVVAAENRVGDRYLELTTAVLDSPKSGPVADALVADAARAYLNARWNATAGWNELNSLAHQVLRAGGSLS